MKLSPALLLAAIWAPCTGAAMPDPAADPHARVRGMTVSCPNVGQIWGTDLMRDTLAELRELGVNWITIHPYAAIHADGSVGGGAIERLYDDPVWLTRPIAEAHALGLKILIKPHLAYWGSPFGWPGEIRFESEAQWRRFFESYERWIVRVAELARGADAFVVGTELEGTVHHEAAWRKIVEAVRRRTTAPLTYSAGWDTFERVPFWDALDVIGIQAYFPLVEREGLPTQGELDDAWAALMRRLDDFGERHGRRIVFGELGYNLSSDAARRPWEYAQGGPDAEEIQRRCMAAALGAIEASETVVGAFLWKWFPDEGRGRRNFLMSTPSMRAVITRFWPPPK